MITPMYIISKVLKRMRFSAVRNSTLGKKSRIFSGSHIVNSLIGNYSYVGYDCTLIGVIVGNFCSIADNCIIGGANHPVSWVSTSPVFHSGRNALKINFARNDFQVSKVTEIGNDVWLGNNVLVKSGVKIGNGSIVGMGSVVTKNIGEYEIWAGNPAKMIRRRFDLEVSQKLSKLEWWNYSEKRLFQIANSMNDIEEFLKGASNENSTLG